MIGCYDRFATLRCEDGFLPAKTGHTKWCKVNHDLQTHAMERVLTFFSTVNERSSTKGVEQLSLSSLLPHRPKPTYHSGAGGRCSNLRLARSETPASLWDPPFEYSLYAYCDYLCCFHHLSGNALLLNRRNYTDRYLKAILALPSRAQQTYRQGPTVSLYLFETVCMKVRPALLCSDRLCAAC